jgi:hypothetical protein
MILFREAGASWLRDTMSTDIFPVWGVVARRNTRSPVLMTETEVTTTWYSGVMVTIGPSPVVADVVGVGLGVPRVGV